MSLEMHRRGQIGVNAVEAIILREWKCRWQSIDAQNDDGVDGLIFIEAGGEMTGQVIFAQVKCMSSAKISQNGKYRLGIGKTKLDKNLKRWRRLVGAVIIIYVNPDNQECFWVNARERGAIEGSQVFIPKDQPFNKLSKGSITQLCGNIHRDLLDPHITTEAADYRHLEAPDHIQKSARRLYISLKEDPVMLGGYGPVVHFDRNGWRHITRPERRKLTRYQSLTLLGAARKILENTSMDMLRIHKSKDQPNQNFVSARAAVSFPFRQTAIVKIILRVIEKGDEEFYTFHTIYEPRRRRNVLGGREPLPL